MASQRRQSLLLPFIVFFGVLAVVVIAATGLIGKFNPFRTEHKDHSPPPILLELREMADLHASQAQFEVLIDHEDDVRYIPSALAGERVQFVGVGTVDAVLDLTTLSADAIAYDSKTNSAVITLPAPTIAEPVLDHAQSHVMNRDRGVFNRIAGLFSDNPTTEDGLYQAASAKMADAAAQSGLVALAEQHAEDLLTGMVTRLGVDHVQIIFDNPPAK
ncbi:MAG: hypothetical protein JWN62_4313 [Acidimicrobiales bacterium]|nr:hypothetical protein [Acidimicrobiales bacterium]